VKDGLRVDSKRSIRRIPAPGTNFKQALQRLKSQGVIQTNSRAGDEAAEQLIKDGYISAESLVTKTDKFTLLVDLIHDAKILEVTKLIDSVPKEKVDDWIWRLGRYKYKRLPYTSTAIAKLRERKVDKFAQLVDMIKNKRELDMTRLIDTIRRQELGYWIERLEKKYGHIPETAVAIAKMKNRRGF
jgi:hypothetical protein